LPTNPEFLGIPLSIETAPRGGSASLAIAQARRAALKYARLWLQAVHIWSLAVGCPYFVSQLNGEFPAPRIEGRNGKEVVEELETVAFSETS
jgi:hypothetical protein